MRRRKSTKGWEGNVADPSVAIAPVSVMNGECLFSPRLYTIFTPETDELSTTLRTIETIGNADGSATSHVVVRCTLTDIAKATNLRIEDAAFAMNECGLLVKRLKGNGKDNEVEEVIMVSREMVEAVAKERKVKKTCIDLAHVLLDKCEPLLLHNLPILSNYFAYRTNIIDAPECLVICNIFITRSCFS